jgi:hypothetical protein
MQEQEFPLEEETAGLLLCLKFHQDVKCHYVWTDDAALLIQLMA